jgi:hypothetical protein
MLCLLRPCHPRDGNWSAAYDWGYQWENEEKQGDTSFTFRYKFASHASGLLNSILVNSAMSRAQVSSFIRIFHSTTALLWSSPFRYRLRETVEPRCWCEPVRRRCACRSCLAMACLCMEWQRLSTGLILCGLSFRAQHSYRAFHLTKLIPGTKGAVLRSRAFCFVSLWSGNLK